MTHSLEHLFSGISMYSTVKLGYFLVPKLQSSTSSISKIYDKKLEIFRKYAKKKLNCTLKETSTIIRDQTIIRKRGQPSSIYTRDSP